MFSRSLQLSVVLAACVIMLVAGATFSEFQHDQPESRPTTKYGSTGGAKKVSELIGANVLVRQDQSIGKIDDLVLSDDGCVEYLVVLRDNKYVLVPWGVAQVNYDRRAVLVEIQRDRFQEIPTFTKDHWPNLEDAQYVERLQTFYDVKPGKERRIDRRDDRRRNR